jgi:hypothetical protein
VSVYRFISVKRPAPRSPWPASGSASAARATTRGRRARADFAACGRWRAFALREWAAASRSGPPGHTGSRCGRTSGSPATRATSAHRETGRARPLGIPPRPLAHQTGIHSTLARTHAMRETPAGQGEANDRDGEGCHQAPAGNRTTKRRPRSRHGQASRCSLDGRLRSREAIARALLSSSSRVQVSRSTSGAPLSHRAEA